MPAPGPLDRPLTPAEEARNAYASACRRKDPPEVIARLRRELEDAREAVKIDAHLAAIDAAGRAGVMSPEQRETLSRLFQYGPAPEAAELAS